MTFIENRDLSGKLVKATFNIDQKEIVINPFRGKTWIHINDRKKSKSVSINILEFMKMVEGLKDIVSYHNQFFPNNQLVMEQPQQVMQQHLDQNTSSRTNRPQPTPARTDEPQPTSARTDEPQPTPARTDEPQPTSARTNEPQSTPAKTDKPQPTSARTNKPQSTPARTTDEPQSVPDYNLAQQHETIPKQRKRACDSQLSQAERMVKRSPVDLKSGEVGDNVAIPTPMVDKGRGDSLLTNCGVNVECTVTFRQAVKATTSGGQWFCRCDSANGKKQCQTNRCKCYKDGKMCNSRCHNSVTCKNK